jgi:hypothetical protein
MQDIDRKQPERRQKDGRPGRAPHAGGKLEKLASD